MDHSNSHSEHRRLIRKLALRGIAKSCGESTMEIIGEQPTATESEFVIANLTTGTQHPLRMGLNMVGRSSRNQIVLESECTSRQHAAILVHAGGTVEVYDLGSFNGIRVNGRSVGVKKLRTGDLVEMGGNELLLTLKTEPPS